MSGDAKYFQTKNKGEIRELQDDLNSIDKNKIKEAVKKVIANMTVGKDVSGLFPHVIKSMGTENIELKKLIYLYIINYARSQPEKAILVVNTFQKDATKHPNPLVRALAIRTMGCIRVDKITEYLCDPLYIALKDQDPYVRKTAALCVAKLYDIQADLVEDRGFLEVLRAMISDINPMVVANAVAALTEISESSGIDHFKVDSNTLSKLLTALNECTEWGRVFILEALSKFDASPAQAKDICERVVPQLQHANSAVVMAAVKVVVQFLTKVKKDQVEKFCQKLAPPLVTLISSTQPEIQYVALRNIDLIVQRYPRVLQNEIRVFFVKYNDAPYVKMEKLEILIKLANKRNVEQVLMEFKEYAQEIDVEFVRRAVRAIGRVAIKLEPAAEKCVKVLSDLVKTKVSYVVQESVIVIKDIFRRYPRRYEKIIVTLCENLEALDEPQAKASMIWIIGDYAERISDADERLDYFIDTFEEENPTVQLQLLTATVKLFLKKPDKSKDLVQKVLNLATEKSDNPDLRDRGYVYWRLLSTDPAAAKAVVLADRPVISSEDFGLPQNYLDELLQNVSSLASVYHRLPSEFVRGGKGIVFKPHADQDDDDEEDMDSSEDSSSSVSSSDEEEQKRAPKKQGKVAAVKQVVAKPKEEPVDDLLGDIFGASVATSAPQQTGGTGGGMDILGEFDPFGGAPVQAQMPQLPPMANVLLGDLANGLNLDAGYARKNGQAVMVIRASNQGQNGVAKIDLKLNSSNYLGIQAATSLALNGALNMGNTQVVDVPLSLGGQVQQNSPLVTTIQVAVRVGYVGGTMQVYRFETDVPPHIFFEENAKVEQQKFLQTWKGIDPGDAQSLTIQKTAKTRADVEKIISDVNGVFVAPREIPNRGVSLYFSATLQGNLMLLEISLANSGACRIAVRSTSKYLSFVSANAVLPLLQ